MKYIIIGNGAAGIAAAQKIRKNDPDGDISIISDSEHLHYYKPGLIELLSQEKTIENLIVFKKDFYEKNRINNILNTTITSINTDEKFVSNGKESFYYDKILISSGAIPFIPPITGNDLNGVFTLHNAADAAKISGKALQSENIVVIGGGLLGLETANSLYRPGKNISIIESAEWLLPRQLDLQGGSTLQNMLEKRGLNFYKDANINSITGEDGTVSKVFLKSGVEIKADSVIISTGIRPDISFLSDSGIETGNGIIVNNHMQTSSENVYAAGDIAEHNGRVYGLWNPSREQGTVAGANMSNVQTEYTGSSVSNNLKIAGIELFSAGNINSENTETEVSLAEDQYIKISTKEGCIDGIIVLGNKDAVSTAKKIMAGKAAPQEILNHFSETLSPT